MKIVITSEVRDSLNKCVKQARGLAEQGHIVVLVWTNTGTRIGINVNTTIDQVRFVLENDRAWKEA